MKLSAANLKNLDYKKLLINHGEKIGIGVVAVLVVLILYGTNWARYQGTPEQMHSEVAKAADQLKQSQWDPQLRQYVVWADTVRKANGELSWPAEVDQQVADAHAQLQKQLADPQERESLLAAAPKENLRADVDRMFAGVQVTRYLYPPDGQMFAPLVKQRKAVHLPNEWQPVAELQGASGRFLMPIASQGSESTEGLLADAQGAKDETAGEKGSEEELSDKDRALKEMLRKRFLGENTARPTGPAGIAGPGGGHGGPGGGHGGPGAGHGGPGGGHGADMASVMPRPGGNRGRGPNMAGMMPPGMEMPAMPGMMEGMEGMESYMASVAGGYSGMGGEGKGVRYVAVTGAYPFKEQFDKLFEAMNEPSVASQNPRTLLEITNFELQRQTARPGANPWPQGDEGWEDVDLEASAKVIYEEALNLAAEIVPANYTDPVITSALPGRGMGDWDPEEVSHPRIKAHLDKAQRAFQLMIDTQIAQMKKDEEQAGGGFSRFQRDLNTARLETMQSMGTQRFMTTMSRQIFGEGEDVNQGTQYLQSQMSQTQMLSTQTDWLLFRYFDFDVEPGQTYRYRVRLTVRNPAYGRPDVLTPEMAEGETRQTPWSEPTPPITVEKDAQYFLADVEPPRGRNSVPTALLDLYQWFPKTGTWSKGEKVTVTPGQFIGSKVKAWILEPLKPALEEQEWEFATNDVLVDLSDAPQRLDGEHADLGLTATQRTALGLSDHAVVVDRFGRLTDLASRIGTGDRTYYDLVLEFQNKNYQDIKGMQAEAAKQEQSIEDMLLPDAEMMYGAGQEGGGRGGRKPVKNPLRRRSFPAET